MRRLILVATIVLMFACTAQGNVDERFARTECLSTPMAERSASYNTCEGVPYDLEQAINEMDQLAREGYTWLYGDMAVLIARSPNYDKEKFLKYASQAKTDLARYLLAMFGIAHAENIETMQREMLQLIDNPTHLVAYQAAYAFAKNSEQCSALENVDNFIRVKRFLGHVMSSFDTRKAFTEEMWDRAVTDDELIHIDIFLGVLRTLNPDFDGDELLTNWCNRDLLQAWGFNPSKMAEMRAGVSQWKWDEAWDGLLDERME